MNILIRTIFLAIMVVAVSQPAQAGKFKDFFTGKKDKSSSTKVKPAVPKQTVKKEVKKMAKPEKKAKAKKAKIASKRQNVDKKQKKQPKNKVSQPVAVTNKLQTPSGLGKVPKLVLASTWVSSSRKNAVIKSEQELDEITRKKADARAEAAKKSAQARKIKKAEDVKNKAALVKAEKAKKTESKKQVAKVKSKGKKVKKESWFKRMFKKNKDPKK